jgi:DNA gyrase subunit A
MGRATSGVSGMKFRDSDSLLSMSVIRAAQVAAEQDAGLDEGEDTAAGVAKAEEAEAAAARGQYFGVHPQYVFTITDGGYAKRTRITEYRLQSRGGIGIKAMKLDNSDRGQLVGAFIVEEGDEILAITNSGQVVRSPINTDFRPTGRSTQGVRFVSPKNGDAVAVVARAVDRDNGDVNGDVNGDANGDGNGDTSGDTSGDVHGEDGGASAVENSEAADAGATIDESGTDPQEG